MLKLEVIVEQNEPTPWVNSITIVKKPNKICVCLDPTKLNKAILRGPYPNKTIEEVVMKTSNAKLFSVVDASSGYWQIELDEESSKLCTFSTPWRGYRYTRLPFGIKMARDIFVQELNKVLGDLPGVSIVTDDILIYGSTIQPHKERLELVFERARKANLKLNSKKSKICNSEVKYVGHILSLEGLNPNADCVQAISEMPEPKDKAAVQQFLGMIGYIGKFIANLSEVTKLLRILLNKEVQWHWQHEQKQAFQLLKKLLVTAPVLQYYDMSKIITLQVDTSKSGLGAALFQDNRHIGMASKALDNTQSSNMFWQPKFHEYIFRKEVTVETDHKPLVSILHKPHHMLFTHM